MNILTKVKYTNDEKMLYPKVASNNGDEILIKFSELGKYKSHNWQFQKECRFVITIIPASHKELYNSPDGALLLERLETNVDIYFWSSKFYITLLCSIDSHSLSRTN